MGNVENGKKDVNEKPLVRCGYHWLGVVTNAYHWLEKEKEKKKEKEKEKEKKREGEVIPAGKPPTRHSFFPSVEEVKKDCLKRGNLAVPIPPTAGCGHSLIKKAEASIAHPCMFYESVSLKGLLRQRQLPGW